MSRGVLMAAAAFIASGVTYALLDGHIQGWSGFAIAVVLWAVSAFTFELAMTRDDG